MPQFDLNSLTLGETLAAADEMGISMTIEQAKALTLLIVSTKFPTCIREHLREYSRRVETQTPPG